MALNPLSSPHIHSRTSVSRVMTWVIFAMLPGCVAHLYFFGWGLLITSTIAILSALICEGLVMRLRSRPMQPALTDLSVVVTALLLAVSLPPLSPWWITVIGTAFAVLFAKHLYGGLGFNPFNPAMVGYAMLLVSFPREMTSWAPPLELANVSLSLIDTARYMLQGTLPPSISMDALTMATPLDAVKTDVALNRDLDSVLAAHATVSTLAGVGWEWINGMFLLGGLWLIYTRVIASQIPLAMISTLGLLALLFHLIDPTHYAAPLFHLFGGATMLGAFFIATDPVTAAATPTGRMVYGIGIGALVFVIRTWGGYPDAVAFAVLLMNIFTPILDQYTQPRVFGHRRR